MRKCPTCGQWRGHVDCLRGEEVTECGDCRKACPPVDPQQKLLRENFTTINHALVQVNVSFYGV